MSITLTVVLFPAGITVSDSAHRFEIEPPAAGTGPSAHFSKSAIVELVGHVPCPKLPSTPRHCPLLALSLLAYLATAPPVVFAPAGPVGPVLPSGPVGPVGPV